MDSDVLGDESLVDQADISSPRWRQSKCELEQDLKGVDRNPTSDPSFGAHETGEQQGAEAQDPPQVTLSGNLQDKTTAGGVGNAVGVRLFSGMGKEQPVATAPPSGATPSKPMSSGLMPKLYSGMRGPEDKQSANGSSEAKTQNVPAPVRLYSGMRSSDPSRSFKRGLPDSCTVDRPGAPSRLWTGPRCPEDQILLSPTALRKDPALLERLAQQPPTPVGTAVSPKDTSRFDCSADAEKNAAKEENEEQGDSVTAQEGPGGGTGEEGESRPPSRPQSEDGQVVDSLPPSSSHSPSHTSPPPALAQAALHSSLRKDPGAAAQHVSLPPPSAEEGQVKGARDSPAARRVPPMLSIPNQHSQSSGRLFTGRTTPTTQPPGTSRSHVVNASLFPALTALPARYSGGRGEGTDGMLLTPRSTASAPTLPIWGPKDNGLDPGMRSPVPVPKPQACHVGTGEAVAVAGNRDRERRRRSFTAGDEEEQDEGAEEGPGALQGMAPPALRGAGAMRRLARVGTTMLAPRSVSSGGVGLQEGALTEVLQRLGALDLHRRLTPSRRLPGDESGAFLNASAAFIASVSSFRGPAEAGDTASSPDEAAENGDEPTLLEECLQRRPSAFDVAGFDPEGRPTRRASHEEGTRQPGSPAVDDHAPQAFVDDMQALASSLRNAPSLPPLASTANRQGVFNSSTARGVHDERELPPPLASSLLRSVDRAGVPSQGSQLLVSKVSQMPQVSQVSQMSQGSPGPHCPPIMPIHVSLGDSDPKAAEGATKTALASSSGRSVSLPGMSSSHDAMSLSVSTQQPMPFSPVKPSRTPQSVRSRRALSEAFLQDKTRALSSDELRTVAVFVPSLVVDLVLAGGNYEPFSVDLDNVAVLLVDISGFTKLCEACANGTLTLTKQQESDDAQASLELARVNSIHASAMGARMFRMSNQAEVEGFGAENVREILNHYFGVLVEIIYRYDGDVIRIAGDALICLFAAPPTSPETGRLAPPPSPSRAARRSTLQRVLKCAEACVSAIRAIRTPDIPLDVHVGVGWGSVRCYHVGSDELGWQMVVSGDPLTQVGEAIELAEGGECVVSPQTWAEAAKYHLQVNTDEQLAGGFHRLVIADDSHLDEEEGEEGEVDEFGDPVQRAPTGDSARANMLARLRQGGISEAGKRKLLGYTPILVHAGVLEEGTGLQSEIRNVTVMFLLIDTTAVTGAEDARVQFSVLQSAFALAQATIIEHEGLLKELSVDDKGLVLVAGFGLHSVLTDNFASSACKAALALCCGLNHLRLGGHVGLATGRVFCASLGNRERREFALVSDTVNTAARLMSLGMKGGSEYALSHEQLCRIDPHRASELHHDVAGSVVVERHTYARADISPNLDFIARPPVSVKGKSVMLEVYLPSLASHDGLLRTRRLADELPCLEPMAYDEFVSRCLTLFDVRRVEEQLLDILWVRSEGNALYLNLLVDSIKALLATRPSNPDQPRSLSHSTRQANFCALPSHDHAFIQSVASVVPEGLQEVFSRRLACLPRAHVIVLKVLCVLGEGSLCLVLHLFHSLPTLSRYWAAQRSNTTARRRITADRANRAAHPDASSNTPSTPDAAAPAEESGHASSGGYKGEDDATASRRGVKGIPVPPVMPASPLIADSPMTRAELLAVFRLLQRYGFLDFDGSTECYSLREPLLIDYLYTSIPFRQRVAFHGLAAEWMLEYTGHKMGNAALLYPLLMHHLSMAFQEARSAAIMNLLQVLGPSYLETWVLLRLSECPRFVDVASCGATRAQVMQRGMGCLSAFPWLRGLARVMHANRVASKVVSFVSQLKNKWLLRVAERRLMAPQVVYAPHIRASQIQTVWRRTHHDRKRRRAGRQAGHQEGGTQEAGEETRKLLPNVPPQETEAVSMKMNASSRLLTAQAAGGIEGNATLRSPHPPKNLGSSGGVTAEKPGTDKANGLNTEAHGLQGSLRPLLSPNESMWASKNALATSTNNGAVDPGESLRSNEQAWR